MCESYTHAKSSFNECACKDINFSLTRLNLMFSCFTLDSSYGKNETGDQRLVVAAKLLPTAAEEAPYAVQDAKFPELPENK